MFSFPKTPGVVVTQKDATDEPELSLYKLLLSFITLLFWHYQFEHFSYKLIDCPVSAGEGRLNKLPRFFSFPKTVSLLWCKPSEIL